MIPLTNTKLTDCLADVDRPSPSTKKLTDNFLYYRALDWEKLSPLAMSDLQGTVACIMPHNGETNTRNRKSMTKTTYASPSYLMGDSSVSVDSKGRCSAYIQHVGGAANGISCIARAYGLLPPTGQLYVEFDRYSEDSYCSGSINVTAYATNYLSGASQSYFSEYGGGPRLVGPYTITSGKPYLVISLTNEISGGSNRRQGSSRWQNVRAWVE